MGANGRIEEHGLHVLLGYYDHTFDMMGRCYEALDRAHSDPICPIRTWDEAVAPSNLVGVVDTHDGAWEPWVARFSPVTGRPGRRSDTRLPGVAQRDGRPRCPLAAPADRLPVIAADRRTRCGRLHCVQHLADAARWHAPGIPPRPLRPSSRAPH